MACTDQAVSVSGGELTAKLHKQGMHQANLRSLPCYLLHTCMHMGSGKICNLAWPALGCKTKKKRP